MAKLVIDVKQDHEPQEGELIVFTNGAWQITTHSAIFEKEIKKIQELEKKVEENNCLLNKFKADIRIMANAIKGGK